MRIKNYEIFPFLSMILFNSKVNPSNDTVIILNTNYEKSAINLENKK